MADGNFSGGCWYDLVDVGNQLSDIPYGNPSSPQIASDDPYVTVSNATAISGTQTTATISVAANAPIETDFLQITCDTCYVLAIAPVYIGLDNGTNLGVCTQCQAQAGAPINVTNGNVWIQQQDCSLPGLGGGLGLVRTWNSLSGSVGAPSVAGMFGQHWRSTYEEILAGPDSNNNYKYWCADGSAWTFAYNPVLNSYFLAFPPDQRAQLVSNPTGGFTLTLANGTQKLFNSQDLLAAIIDRNNNQTTIAYDSNNRITSVTSPGGSTLNFTYGDPNNLMQATTVQDSVGVVATYTYDSSSRLTLVSYPAPSP